MCRVQSAVVENNYLLSDIPRLLPRPRCAGTGKEGVDVERQRNRRGSSKKYCTRDKIFSILNSEFNGNLDSRALQKPKYGRCKVCIVIPDP